MREKERGYVLAVDPASNSCGVSLWRDGQFVAARTLVATKNAVYSVRLYELRELLITFIAEHINIAQGEYVETVVCEGVRSRLVQVPLGALLAIPEGIRCALSPKNSFVESMQWKRWARINGAQGATADIKGLTACREVGLPVDEWALDSDDVADSVLVYKCWAAR